MLCRPCPIRGPPQSNFLDVPRQALPGPPPWPFPRVFSHGSRHGKFEGAGNMHKWLSGETRRGSLSWRRAVLGAIVATGFLAPVGAQALPAGCAALAEKYPDWKGKTLVN